jgi:hypothetical protein
MMKIAGSGSTPKYHGSPRLFKEKSEKVQHFIYFYDSIPSLLTKKCFNGDKNVQVETGSRFVIIWPPGSGSIIQDPLEIYFTDPEQCLNLNLCKL